MATICPFTLTSVGVPVAGTSSDVVVAGASGGADERCVKRGAGAWAVAEAVGVVEGAGGG